MSFVRSRNILSFRFEKKFTKAVACYTSKECSKINDNHALTSNQCYLRYYVITLRSFNLKHTVSFVLKLGLKMTKHFLVFGVCILGVEAI